VTANRALDPSPHRALPFGERGSGTVLVAGAIGAVTLASAGVLVVSEAIHQTHRAASAADLAALAAAAGLARGEPVDCAAAVSVATPVGARVVRCSGLRDGSVLVVVEVSTRWPTAWAGLPGSVTGVARAGPTAQTS
jgi:secretion/DNA translocation related TadE-like protein